MQGAGIAEDTRIDWAELVAFKRTFTEPVPEQQEKMYAESGISVLHGSARFTGENTLDIDGESVAAGHVLLASGARPVRLGIPGETHEGFMERDSLPQRIVSIGGGYLAASSRASPRGPGRR